MVKKLVLPVGKRTAAKTIDLREELLCAIDNMIWFRKLYYKYKLRHKHSKIEVTIKPLSFWELNTRRIFQITLSIVEKIRDAAGKMKTFIHKRTFEWPIEFAEITFA